MPMLAALLVASASIAGAAMYTTNTGVFGLLGKTENDTTELLLINAPDFPPLARTLVRDIPYPPGDSAFQYLPTWIQLEIDQAKPDGTLIQAAGIRGTFAFRALCSWRGYWLRARADGDTTTQAAAATGMRTVADYMESHGIRDSMIPQYRQAAADEAAGSLGTPIIQATFTAGCGDELSRWMTP
jgi:hypothetical protein